MGIVVRVPVGSLQQYPQFSQLRTDKSLWKSDKEVDIPVLTEMKDVWV